MVQQRSRPDYTGHEQPYLSKDPGRTGGFNQAKEPRIPTKKVTVRMETNPLGTLDQQVNRTITSTPIRNSTKQSMNTLRFIHAHRASKCDTEELPHQRFVEWRHPLYVPTCANSSLSVLVFFLCRSLRPLLIASRLQLAWAHLCFNKA